METTREQVEVTRRTLDAQIAVLQENKTNLSAKIDEAIANLEVSKKSSFGAQIVDKDSVLRPQATDKKVMNYVDFEGLMSLIKAKLYGKQKDLTKEPVQTLQVSLMRLVNRLSLCIGPRESSVETYRADNFDA